MTLPFWCCGTWRASVWTWLYRIAANADRRAHPEARIKPRAVAAVTRWGHAPEHPTCSHLGLFMPPALAIELTAAGTGSSYGALHWWRNPQDR
jgi:hypothetical protein